MRKLSLSEIASIAEIIGAVAVIVSLVFVIQSLRANTTAVESASVIAVTNASRESLLAVATDTDLARIAIVGDEDPSALDDLDSRKYFVYHRQLWLNFQNAWTQWRLGIIDDESWRGYADALCSIMSSPGPRLQWPSHVPALNRGFADVVEACEEFKDG